MQFPQALYGLRGVIDQAAEGDRVRRRIVRLLNGRKGEGRLPDDLQDELCTLLARMQAVLRPILHDIPGAGAT